MLIPALGDLGIKVMIGRDAVLGVVWLVIAAAIGRMHRERMDVLAGQ